jgi:8-oxo-dGTP pyrophosphatase MutT (NUDIX family)
VSGAAGWKSLGKRALADHRIFRLEEERYESPRNTHVIDAVVLHAPDWVNVIALTPGRQCVMIRQFRFGTAAVHWEIPGGMIDPGEQPLTAAMRELREETGYVAARWSALGSVAPNPAFQSNRLHTFLAEDAALEGQQELDASEDIAVQLVPEAELDGMLARGTIDHALVAVAFHKLDLHRRGLRIG